VIIQLVGPKVVFQVLDTISCFPLIPH